MLRFATPLIFGAMGGIMSERSGVINIGLEGMMLMGAFFGIFGADLLGSWFLGILVGVAAGALMGLVHAFVSISLRADQVVSGTGINFLALGITGYVFIYHYGDQGTPSDISRAPNLTLPLIEDIPFIGEAIGKLNMLTWVALLLVPLLTVYLFRTRGGLRLRSVGEKPRAADSLGLPVLRTRYLAVTASGALAALGGVYLSIALLGSFNEKMTAGRGFIALAAVIFGGWRPWGALAGALPVRLLDRARAAAAGLLRVHRRAVPGTAVCLDPGRGGRRHRPLPTARRNRRAVREGVVLGRIQAHPGQPHRRAHGAPQRRGRALPAHLQHAAALERRDAPARARARAPGDGLEPASARRQRRARPRRLHLRDPAPARRHGRPAPSS